MAQETSSLWKALLRTKGTKKEYQFDINGTVYGPEREVEHSVDAGLYEEFGIGNAATAKLTLKLYADSRYNQTVRAAEKQLPGDGVAAQRRVLHQPAQ